MVGKCVQCGSNDARHAVDDEKDVKLCDQCVDTPIFEFSGDGDAD